MGKSIGKRLAIIIIQFIVIMFGCLLYVEECNSINKVRLVKSYASPDKIHKILIYEIGQTYPLGSSTVRINIASDLVDKGESKPYYTMQLPTEGSVHYSNFDIEWIDGGVIINAINLDGYNRRYRILWDDVFENM